MATPFIGEIKVVPYNFAMVGWAFCDGSLLPISQYSALFQLIGTTYGGDGVSTLGLPDLRGRVPVGIGAGFNIGQLGGSETVTLTTEEIPNHNHLVQCTKSAANSVAPANDYPAVSARKVYGGRGDGTYLTLDSIANTGQTQPHDNMQPFLGISYVISLFGIFPTQS